MLYNWGRLDESGRTGVGIMLCPKVAIELLELGVIQYPREYM